MSKILVPMLGLSLLVSCASAPAPAPAPAQSSKALCDRKQAPNNLTVDVQGTLWSDLHHGAYFRPDGCSDIAWRLGRTPEDADATVKALLTDLLQHPGRNGVMYRLDAEGHLISTPQGRRLILSKVASYELLEE